MTTNTERAELIDLVSDAVIDADLPPKWCLDNHEKLQRFAAALLEADTQRPALRIGHYEISKRAYGSFWIQHDSGEGMQISEDKLYQCISEFYCKNF